MNRSMLLFTLCLCSSIVSIPVVSNKTKAVFGFAATTMMGAGLFFGYNVMNHRYSGDGDITLNKSQMRTKLKNQLILQSVFALTMGWLSYNLLKK